MRCIILAIACFASAALAQERPIVIGAAVAQSGFLADLGRSYGRGLAYWAAEVNARGGILGRSVEVKVRDDQSAASAAEALYAKLIDEDRADVLLGPVGSAATLSAMAVAEKRRRVLVNATGIDAAVLRRGNRYAIQVPAPAEEYGARIWPLLLQHDAKRALLVDRDESGLAARLRADAEKLPVELVKGDPAGPGGVAALIDLARARAVDALIVVGPPGAAAETVKAMKKAGYAPRLFIATAGMHREFIRQVGQDAEYAISVAPYAPALRTSGNAAFVAGYRARHGQAPDFFAACAYAAGRMVEAALREAGAPDQERLREAFLRVRVDTPLGTHEAGKDGAQAGARPVLLQMQKGRREIVWPASLATAKLVLPYPDWAGRTLLQ